MKSFIFVVGIVVGIALSITATAVISSTHEPIYLTKYAMYIDSYKQYEDKIKNDEVIKLIGGLCNQSFENTFLKTKCILEYIDSRYEYVWHNETFRTPMQFFQEGGVCRDFSVISCAAINYMKANVTCGYVFTKNHVFPILDFTDAEDVENNYCTYDGYWQCHSK
jgi:hypothetical protein